MKEVKQMLQAVLETLDYYKAKNINTISLKDKSDIADYIVIASSTSRVHGNALTEKIMEKMKKFGINYSAVDGQNAGNWIVIDLNHIIVHIFLPEVREFYKIDDLWEYEN